MLKNPEQRKGNTAESRISKTPGVVGGEARIRDTRIPVWTLVRLKQLGLKDGAIRTYFEQPLATADLVAAWTYYENNRKEIEKAVRENEAE